MTKHGDFCLLPDLMWLLFPALWAFFAWGWFAPAMPMVGDLILVAIFALGLAYLAKIVLKRIDKPGTLWTRVLGCLTSAMVVLGHLGLVWGVANGIRYHVVMPHVVKPSDTDLLLYSFILSFMFITLSSFLLILALLEGGSIPKDGGGKVDYVDYCYGGGEVDYCEGANCGDGLDYDSAPDCSPLG